MSCRNCPRACESRSSGFCGVGNRVLVARIAPHFWEEPVISGTRGAGTVFFSGCNMRCVFCQNREISAGLKGEAVDAAALERHIRAMLAQGVHNVEFVTPSHYALFLAEFLETHRYEVPVVWNSSGYDSTAVLEQLRGKVQVFLPDLKYADAALARRYGAAPDYVQTAREALEKMYALVGDTAIGDDGLLKKGVIIRHLMLPGQPENTLAVIDAVHDFAKGKKVLFSLMSQYTPCGDLARFPELQRTISESELESAWSYAAMLGLEGFCQDLASADTKYIPPFSDSLSDAAK